jgi:CheY-like chemotaxis protein
MSRIVLIHWNAQEADERARRLRRAGHRVVCHTDRDGQSLREIGKKPPNAIVIDLNRLPAQGRAVATWLRQQLATRHVPLVFIEGDPEKTKRVRDLLPDAVYTAWSRIRSAIRKAIQKPPRNPVVPGTMDSYSGTPLLKKLGIYSGLVVALLGAPRGFENTMGALPVGVQIRKRARGRAHVILLFAKSSDILKRRFPDAERTLSEGGKLWLIWPKKTSGVATDLSQSKVRAFGLAAGLVDYKISAIDETWSGLCFTRRRARRKSKRS